MKCWVPVLLFLALVAIDGLSALNLGNSPDSSGGLGEKRSGYSKDNDLTSTKTDPQQEHARDYNGQSSNGRIVSPSQNRENTRKVESVHEYGKKHQQESSYNEESSSSFVVGQEGLTKSQSGSRSNRNSESNSAFNRNQRTEDETSRSGGTAIHRKSESGSNAESEDFQETSGSSSYKKQEQSNPGNQDQNGENIREVESVHEYGSKHQQESSYDEESSSSFVVGQEGLTKSQSGSRSNRNSEINNAFDRNQRTEDETSRNGGTTIHRKTESGSNAESEDFQEASGSSSYKKQGQSNPGNQGQNGENIRKVESVHEYGKKHQQESSYNEESSSSFVVGQEGLTKSQSGSRSNRNSESNNAFNRNQQTEDETSRNDGTTIHRRSESDSNAESEDFQETSGSSSYKKQGQSNPGNQDQNGENIREVNSVNEYRSKRQQESSYKEEEEEGLTSSQSESRSSKNSEGNNSFNQDQQTEDETSRNDGTTFHRRSESGSKSESEDLRETSGSSSYIQQGHSYPGSQDQNGENTREVNSVHEYSSKRQQESSYNEEEEEEGLTSSQFESRSNKNSESNNSFNQNQQTEDETSRNDETTIHRRSESGSNAESEDFQETSGSSAYNQQGQGNSGNQGLLNNGESQDESGQYNIKRIIGKPGSPIVLQRGFVRQPSISHLPKRGSAETVINNQYENYENENESESHYAREQLLSESGQHSNQRSYLSGGVPDQVINGAHFEKATGNQGTNSGQYASRSGGVFDQRLNKPRFISGTRNQGPDSGKYVNGIPVQGTNSGQYVIGDENQDVNSKYISEILTKAYELLKYRGGNGYSETVPSGYGNYPVHYVTNSGNRRTNYGNHRIRYYDAATGHYMDNLSSPIINTDDKDTYGDNAPSLVIPTGIAPGSNGYRPDYYRKGDFDTRPSYILGTDGKNPTTIFSGGPGSYNSPVLLDDASPDTNDGNKDKTAAVIHKKFPSNKNNYESESFDYNNDGTYRDASGSIIYKDLLSESTDETRTTYESDHRFKKDETSAFASITNKNSHLDNVNDGANKNNKIALIDETTNEHGHGKLDKNSEILKIVGQDYNLDDERTKADRPVVIHKSTVISDTGKNGINDDGKIDKNSDKMKKQLGNDNKSELTKNDYDETTKKFESDVSGKTSVVENTDNNRSVDAGDISSPEGNDDDDDDKIEEILGTESHNTDGTNDVKKDDDTKIIQDLGSETVDGSSPKDSDDDDGTSKDGQSVIDEISRTNSHNRDETDDGEENDSEITQDLDSKTVHGSSPKGSDDDGTSKDGQSVTDEISRTKSHNRDKTDDGEEDNSEITQDLESKIVHGSSPKGSDDDGTSKDGQSVTDEISQTKSHKRDETDDGKEDDLKITQDLGPIIVDSFDSKGSNDDKIDEISRIKNHNRDETNVRKEDDTKITQDLESKTVDGSGSKGSDDDITSKDSQSVIDEISRTKKHTRDETNDGKEDDSKVIQDLGFQTVDGSSPKGRDDDGTSKDGQSVTDEISRTKSHKRDETDDGQEDDLKITQDLGPKIVDSSGSKGSNDDKIDEISRIKNHNRDETNISKAYDTKITQDLESKTVDGSGSKGSDDDITSKDSQSVIDEISRTENHNRDETDEGKEDDSKVAQDLGFQTVDGSSPKGRDNDETSKDGQSVTDEISRTKSHKRDETDDGQEDDLKITQDLGPKIVDSSGSKGSNDDKIDEISRIKNHNRDETNVSKEYDTKITQDLESKTVDGSGSKGSDDDITSKDSQSVIDEISRTENHNRDETDEGKKDDSKVTQDLGFQTVDGSSPKGRDNDGTSKDGQSVIDEISRTKNHNTDGIDDGKEDDIKIVQDLEHKTVDGSISEACDDDEDKIDKAGKSTDNGSNDGKTKKQYKSDKSVRNKNGDRSGPEGSDDEIDEISQTKSQNRDETDDSKKDDSKIIQDLGFKTADNSGSKGSDVDKIDEISQTKSQNRDETVDGKKDRSKITQDLGSKTDDGSGFKGGKYVGTSKDGQSVIDEISRTKSQNRDETDDGKEDHSKITKDLEPKTVDNSGPKGSDDVGTSKDGQSVIDEILRTKSQNRDETDDGKEDDSKIKKDLGSKTVDDTGSNDSDIVGISKDSKSVIDKISQTKNHNIDRTDDVKKDDSKITQDLGLKTVDGSVPKGSDDDITSNNDRSVIDEILRTKNHNRDGTDDGKKDYSKITQVLGSKTVDGSASKGSDDVGTSNDGQSVIDEISRIKSEIKDDDKKDLSKITQDSGPKTVDVSGSKGSDDVETSKDGQLIIVEVSQTKNHNRDRTDDSKNDDLKITQDLGSKPVDDSGPKGNDDDGTSKDGQSVIVEISQTKSHNRDETDDGKEGHTKITQDLGPETVDISVSKGSNNVGTSKDSQSVIVEISQTKNYNRDRTDDGKKDDAIIKQDSGSKTVDGSGSKGDDDEDIIGKEGKSKVNGSKDAKKSKHCKCDKIVRHKNCGKSGFEGSGDYKIDKILRINRHNRDITNDFEKDDTKNKKGCRNKIVEIRITIENTKCKKSKVTGNANTNIADSGSNKPSRSA